MYFASLFLLVILELTRRWKSKSLLSTVDMSQPFLFLYRILLNNYYILLGECLPFDIAERAVQYLFAL